MFLRIDKLQIELPMPREKNPQAAAAVQELMGERGSKADMTDPRAIEKVAAKPETPHDAKGRPVRPKRKKGE